MLRRWFFHIGVPVLAVAALLLAALPSEARPPAGRGNGQGGISVGPRGFSGGSYGGYYPGSSYPGWLNYGYGPYTYGSQRDYYRFYPETYPDYRESYPYSEPVPSEDYSSFYPADESSAYGGASSYRDRNAAVLRLRVPANAEVWLNGSRMAATGPVREFTSPPLIPGDDYSYDVRVRWMENGRPLERTQKVTFHAGEQVNLDLTTAPARGAASTTRPAPQRGDEELTTPPRPREEEITTPSRPREEEITTPPSSKEVVPERSRSRIPVP